MTRTDRRTFLKVLGSGMLAATATSMPVFRALAQAPPTGDEFFILIHAAGGWDVTLSLDPRNERKGIVDPASTDNTDTSNLRRWVDVPLDADTQSFALVRPAGSNLVFGPAIGDMGDMADRMTLFNGLAMNTVSHPDGTAFAVSGRHLAGGHPAASSVDAMLANEYGTSQLFPVVSVQYPSSFVGSGLDPRAVPLRVGSIDNIAKSLLRSAQYDTKADRDAVTVMLAEEARELAARSYFPETMNGMALQLGSLRRLLDDSLSSLFSASALAAAQPTLGPKDASGKPRKYQGAAATNAAFAVEAMKRNIVRCVSFTFGGFDTHNGNYKFQAETQQEAFDVLASLVRALDASPHPTKTGARLSDHTHILVVSDFCRTPQINLAGGRDHYPNGSAIVVSPRFKTNMVYGKTDADQLLPDDAGAFTDGVRPVSPPDLLATFVSAFGTDPRKYLRDGEVVKEVLVG